MKTTVEFNSQAWISSSATPKSGERYVEIEITDYGVIVATYSNPAASRADNIVHYPWHRIHRVVVG